MIKCPICLKDFLITKDRTIFCSHLCQSKYAIKKASEKRKPKPRSGIYLKCIVCSDDFYVPLYRAKNPKTKYCSRNCLAKDKLAKFIPIHGFKPLNKPLHKYKILRINGKYVRQHRYIMEQHLGRKLERWEHVHHINDDSSDNRLENLEVLSNSNHQRKEFKFRKSITSS